MTAAITMKPKTEIQPDTDGSMEPKRIVRIDSAESPRWRDDHVVAERAITIMVDKVGSFTIMCTPTDAESLAIGFIYSEGIVDSIDDIIAISTKDELPDVVGIEVQDPSRVSIQRNLIVASSCGMCGTRNIEKMFASMPSCGRSLEVSSSLIADVTEKAESMQQLFKDTGGSHAAAIFTAEGDIVAFAEDVGRHSALDKAIGMCLSARREMSGCGVFLSGRISFEIVSKAAKAGIELIAAVSAATSYAVAAAEKWDMTLCGFVRKNRLNVYTHPERLSDYRKSDAASGVQQEQ